MAKCLLASNKFPYTSSVFCTGFNINPHFRYIFTKKTEHVLTAGKYENTKLKRVTLDTSVERNGLIPARCA